MPATTCTPTRSASAAIASVNGPPTGWAASTQSAPACGREVARVLGEDDQPGATGRGELGETRDLGEVRVGVVARGELGDRDREAGDVAVHGHSLRRGGARHEGGSA